MTVSKKRLKEIQAIKDKDIDFSDIPETDAEFWASAELVEPDTTKPVTLRVKKSVIRHFQLTGRGWQTRMNRVLETYVRAQEHNRDNHPDS